MFLIQESLIGHDPVPGKVCDCVGGVISPLLSNIYLTEVDAMLERAKVVTRAGMTTYVEYARSADDLAILVNGQWRNGWLLRAVDRRLREELAKLDLRLNETKSRVVDLTQGEAFGFLGFTLRRLRSTRGRWWVQLAPALKQRTALLRKLKEVFRRWRSQPVRRVIAVINPILRGWVTGAGAHSARDAALDAAVGVRPEIVDVELVDDLTRARDRQTGSRPVRRTGPPLPERRSRERIG